MAPDATPGDDRVRAAEVIGAACLATDLGMGFPLEHGLHATLVTMRLADLLGVDSSTASQTYFLCLLMYAGCNADAHVSSRIFPGGLEANMPPVQFGSASETFGGVLRALSHPEDPPHRRAYNVARGLPAAAGFRPSFFAAMCEVAVMLAERLGLPASVHQIFRYLTERWDGKGVLQRAAADDIPLPLRIVHVGRDASFQALMHGEDQVARIIRRRAGGALDPEVANAFADEAAEVLVAAHAAGSAWDAVLADEPKPWSVLAGDAVDRALAALGDFGDMVSPSLTGHARGVADLAETAARTCGLGDGDIVLARRAGMVHDIGRVAIGSRIWDKAGPLSADEREQVRLHPYHTERLLARSPFLSSLAGVACSHHERSDGTGYHRGVSAASMAPVARLVAAADAFHAMTEPRAHRPGLSPAAAARIMDEESRAGRLDPEMAAAVVEAAGQPRPPIERPAGLTEREAQVVGFLARGLQTKQVARALGISVKTADRHIQNAYRKMGVSTRAAAALFASDHGLVAWGELPISPERAGS